MYPSEVLGDDQLWEKCKPIVERAYSDRDNEMLSVYHAMASVFGILCFRGTA